MVRKIFKAFGGEVSNVHEAAYLLGFFALLAQILALFRDRLLAHYFGASSMLDVYYASFRIPDFLFTTVASLVAGSVLIPFIQEKLTGEKEDAKKMIDEIWSSFSMLIVLTALIAFLFMQFFVAHLFGAMTIEAQQTIVTLSRILLLSPLFLGFSNFLGSIIQAHRRFALYALSPVLYNLGIIVGIIFLFPSFGINGVVIGVVLGSILHAVIQIPFARKVGLFPDFIFPVAFSRLKKIALLSLPRTLALTSMNLVIIILVSLASRMTEGSISIFNFAYNLQTGPLSIIGVSYSMAAFPTLSKLFVTGQKDKFAGHVSMALRHIIFWSLPATAFFIIIRAQIVRTVLGSGAFSWNDTRLTAACVALFSISIVAQSANLLFIRAYYAAGKTKIPFIVCGISAIVTILAAYLFYELFYFVPSVQYFIASVFKVSDVNGVEILSLPLGFTIGNLFNLGLFAFLFEKDFKHLFKNLRDTTMHSLIASFVAGFASYSVLLVIGRIITLDTVLGVFSQGLVAGVVGFLFWFVTLKLLQNKEVEELSVNIKKRIWKAKIVVPERMEI